MREEVDILDIALGDVQLHPRAAALAHELRAEGLLSADPVGEQGHATIVAQERAFRPKAHPTPINWDAAWGEIRSDWIRLNHDQTFLVPRFLRDCGEVIRLGTGYATPHSTRALWAAQRVILSHLACTYFEGFEFIDEFGCGSGFNLLELEKLGIVPAERMQGLDCSRNALMMVRDLGFHATRFDMANAPSPLNKLIAPGFGALTMGALEQLGPRHEAFVHWLIGQRPEIVVNVEPLLELYDDGETDQLAANYHRTRGYLSGFLPKLLDMQERGRIQVLEQHRTRLGARHNDGFSWVVWRPVQ